MSIIVSDALAGLATLADGSVQSIVTSPPYWRQRDYGVAGQLGLESTPEEYVARLVGILREARRALRDDGTLWLNLGDCYAEGGRGGNPAESAHRKQATNAGSVIGTIKAAVKAPAGMKAKDLVGVPWMAAFALRADGWFLRQRNVWAKPNGMPESVTDRSTVSCEEVFHLSKRADYFYDDQAARTPAAPATETRLAQNVEAQQGSLRANGGGKTNGPMKAVSRSSTLTGGAWGRHALGDAIPEGERRKGDSERPDKQRGHSRRHAGFNDRWDQIEREQQTRGGANLRNVWWVAPAQYREGHFAVMPDRIAELCIVPSTRVGDTVLDPFCGAGTTGAVAKRLGREFVGIELNPAYARMAERRIKREPWPNRELPL